MSEEVEFESMQSERLHQQMLQIQNELSEVAAADVARMPERVFREVFLPLFAGDTDLVYKKEATLLNWSRIAGGPYKSVHVVDGNEAILFTVPPLYDRSAINPTSYRGPSLQHIAITAEQYKAQSPAMGRNYLDAKLTERALIMKVPVNVLGHVQTWNEIFKRYGRPPIVDLAPTEQAATSVNNSGDFDVEFVSED